MCCMDGSTATLRHACRFFLLDLAKAWCSIPGLPFAVLELPSLAIPSLL